MPDQSSHPARAAVWLRVSTAEQTSDNQLPDVQRFAAHHGYEIVRTFTVSDSAWKDGGGRDYRAALACAMDAAHAGEFKILIVWSLDRIVRKGAEEALSVFRQFRQRHCTVVSVKESWLNGSPEVQDLLIAFGGWMAERESARRSERVRVGLERRMREQPGWKPGRQPNAKDRKPRKRSGYVKAWEDGGKRRAAAAEAVPS